MICGEEEHMIQKLLYLPVDKSKDRPTVEQQDKNESALLNAVRRLISIRKASPALCVDGEFVPLYAESEKYPLVYLRASGNEKMLIAVNPSRNPAGAQFKCNNIEGCGKLEIGHDVKFIGECGSFSIELKGVSYGIFRV